MHQECTSSATDTPATRLLPVLERGSGWVRIGPLLLTSWTRYKANERNAFEVGAESQRLGLLEGEPATS